MKLPFYLPVLILLGICGFSMTMQNPEAAYREKIRMVSDGPLSELNLRMAETFLGVPYMAHTLEGHASEELVCRFDALDCTTLVDVSAALAIAKKKELSYQDFLGELSKLRYNGGKIDGYASRNHYFLAWRNQNIQRNLVRDISRELGGSLWQKKVNFMSTHPELYKGITDVKVLNKIIDAESEINAESYAYLPKSRVAEIEPQLRDGDIIGITSTIPGLDCNHQGIIKFKNKRAYLLHASTSTRDVTLSAMPLSDYLNSVKRHSGIFVLRLLENY